MTVFNGFVSTSPNLSLLIKYLIFETKINCTKMYRVNRVKMVIYIAYAHEMVCALSCYRNQFPDFRDIRDILSERFSFHSIKCKIETSYQSLYLYPLKSRRLADVTKFLMRSKTHDTRTCLHILFSSCKYVLIPYFKRKFDIYFLFYFNPVTPY